MISNLVTDYIQTRRGERVPNVSTTPIRQWGFQQCLPFSWTTLRGKHCWHPIAAMGVEDRFGLGCLRLPGLKSWDKPGPLYAWLSCTGGQNHCDLAVCVDPLWPLMSKLQFIIFKQFIHGRPKPSLKIRTANAIFLIYLGGMT